MRSRPGAAARRRRLVGPGAYGWVLAVSAPARQDSGVTGSGLRRDWPLVGRDSEFADASAALANRRAVVVAGPGGVGKTRLLGALAEQAAHAGWHVRRAVGSESSRDIPLGALAHLIPATAIDSSRDAVVRAIAVAIDALATPEHPLLVVVDDAHLLDGASATLIAHLVRARKPACAIAMAVRSGAPAPDALAGLWKDGDLARIEVAPLGEPEIARLLATVLGGAIDPLTVRLLFRWTRGNALFLRELVDDGIANGVLRESMSTWTWHGEPTVGPTLREIIDARHARLDGRIRRALEIVAIGEPVPVGALSAVTSPAALAALERQGLVERDGDGDGAALRTAHPLHGEVLRRSLPPSVANELRAAIADAMAGDARGDAHVAMRVAVLRAEAGAIDGTDSFVVAARHAWALRDTALVERLANAALRAGPSPEADYLIGETRADRGDYDGALARWAAVLAADLDDALRTRVAIASATVLALTKDAREEAWRILAEADKQIDDDDGHQRIAAARAALFVHELEPDELDAAIAPYLDPTVADEARVFAWIGSARERMTRGDLRSALDEAPAMLAVAQRAGEDFPLGVMFVGILQFFGHLLMGRLDAAEQVARAGRDASLDDPLPVAPATWSEALGLVALARGHLDVAEDHLRGAAALMRVNDNGTLRLILHELALIHAMRDDPGAVTAALAETETANRGLIEPFVERVRIDAAAAAAAGDATNACRLLRERLGPVDDDLALDAYSALPLLHDLARYGDPAGAAPALARIAAAFDGIWARLCAEQAAALAAGDAVRLVTVATAMDDAGFDLDAAETFMAAASALRGPAARDVRAATALEQRVQDLVARCGAAPVFTPWLARRPEIAALTAREREIAALVAGGSSDAQVAERLVLSVRTVHAHLRAVYRKLGVHDRSALTAVLRGRDQPKS